MDDRTPVPNGPYVIVKLRDQLFAFSSDAVAEMLSLADVRPVPEVPPYIRGVINLRDRVLSVVDLRQRLGMPSALQDLEALLTIFEAREQDHRNWIKELDSCIAERREFKLATDPHKCAFGRWYDGLKTDNTVLATRLRQIDGPHQRVHRRGAEAVACAASGKIEQAAAIAQDIRTRELAGTLALFVETRAALREAHREVAVVARRETGRFAVAVDGVEAVERLAEADVEHAFTLSSGAVRHLVTSIRKRPRDNQLVMVIDLGRAMAA